VPDGPVAAPAGEQQQPAGGSSASPAPDGSRGSGSGSAEPEPDGSGPPQPPVISDPPPPAPSSSGAGGFTVAFTVTSGGGKFCNGPRTMYVLRVNVTAVGGTLRSATLRWRFGTVADSADMEVDHPSAEVIAGPFPVASAGTVTWWVDARATDGRTDSTPTTTSSRSC
jgi:hypothetical protein